MQMAMQMKMQMEMQMGMGPAPSSEWVGGCGHGRGRPGPGRGTWDLGPGSWVLGPGTWDLETWGARQRTSTQPGSTRLFSISLSHSHALSPHQGPGPVPGPGHLGQGAADTHKVQSRYLTIPLAARQPAKYRPRSHLANDGTTQASKQAPAGPSTLVSSCLASTVYRNCRIVVFWALTGSSLYPSVHPPRPFIRTHYSRPYCPACVHPAFQVSQSPVCLRLNGAAAAGWAQSAECRVHGPGPCQLCHSCCHALPLPVLGERRGGKSSTSSAARLWLVAHSSLRLRLQHRLPLTLPALLGVGPAPGHVAYVRTGYNTCVIVRLNLGGSHLQGCPLDPVLSWDGLGCPWDGMHPCRVTRWPGPGSQCRSVAGLRGGRARVDGVCHHRASSVGCLCPMPGLLGLLGLLAVTCWPARPRPARCVFRSWSVANPAN